MDHSHAMKPTPRAVDHFQPLFHTLQAVPPGESDRGVRDGLNAVSHLLDRESLLKMRLLVAQRWPDSESLQIIDRALAQFGRRGQGQKPWAARARAWFVCSVVARLVAFTAEVPFGASV